MISPALAFAPFLIVYLYQAAVYEPVASVAIAAVPAEDVPVSTDKLAPLVPLLNPIEPVTTNGSDIVTVVPLSLILDVVTPVADENLTIELITPEIETEVPDVPEVPLDPALPEVPDVPEEPLLSLIHISEPTRPY